MICGSRRHGVGIKVWLCLTVPQRILFSGLLQLLSTAMLVERTRILMRRCGERGLLWRSCVNVK